MSPGRRLAEGNTADVFALDDGRAEKRFKPGVDRAVANREAANTRLAAECGLPVPAVHEVTTVDGRPAIVFDRVEGPTMLSGLLSNPLFVRRTARRLARLHRAVHDCRPTTGRPVRDRLRGDLERASGLSAATRRRVRSRLDALPDGTALCHGDFHPGNVLLGADGPVVIDWLDAGRGPPAADVARTSLLLRYGGEDESRLFSAFRRLFRWWYLRWYCRESDVARDDVRAWELPVAAARLTEGVPEEESLRVAVETWAGRR